MRQEDFRNVCSRFATGVAVLTAFDEARNPHGLTVNSFASVSLNPPLVLVSIDNNCALLQLFESASRFGLSFLSEAQQDISTRFAFVPERRFEGVDWSVSPDVGVPVISGSLGWMECKVHQLVPAGDHLVLIGEVVAAEASPGGKAPLIYFGSAYRRLGE